MRRQGATKKAGAGEAMFGQITDWGDASTLEVGAAADVAEGGAGGGLGVATDSSAAITAAARNKAQKKRSRRGPPDGAAVSKDAEGAVAPLAESSMRLDSELKVQAKAAAAAAAAKELAANTAAADVEDRSSTR